MSIPKDFHKVANRFDQFKQVECSVYYGRQEDGSGVFFIELNEKVAGPFNRSEIEVLMDSLKNDIDFKRPML